MMYRAIGLVIFTAMIGLKPDLSFADIVRDYDFTGTLASGSIDSTGAFGAVGSNLSGDPFSADVAIDLTQSTLSGGVCCGLNRNASTLSQTLVVNGRTQNLGNSNFTYTLVADAYQTLTTSAFNFYVTQSADVSLPDFDGPGTYPLNCVASACGAYLFAATLSVGSFNTNVTNIAVTDTPVPLPASIWLLLSGLGAMGVAARGTRPV